MTERQLRVGVGAFVFRDGKFLMQRRMGSHGAGTWSVPGGHVEFGEEPEVTAEREVLEETGMTIGRTAIVGVTNDIFLGEGKHYVTIWTVSRDSEGEPYITEPEKCSEQIWTDFENLPDPLFLPWNQLLKSDFVEKIKRDLKNSECGGGSDEI